MISPRAHLALLVMSFFTWAFFVLVGLPDYYQSWPFGAQVAIVIAVTLAYFPLTAWILGFFRDGRHVKNSLWLAFYLTLPLFLYDYVWIVLWGDDDLTFVFRYWYLSLFYFSFWLQMPLVGWWMTRRAPAAGTRDEPA